MHILEKDRQPAYMVCVRVGNVNAVDIVDAFPQGEKRRSNAFARVEQNAPILTLQKNGGGFSMRLIWSWRCRS